MGFTYYSTELRPAQSHVYQSNSNVPNSVKCYPVSLISRYFNGDHKKLLACSLIGELKWLNGDHWPAKPQVRGEDSHVRRTRSVEADEGRRREAEARWAGNETGLTGYKTGLTGNEPGRNDVEVVDDHELGRVVAAEGHVHVRHLVTTQVRWSPWQG